MSSSVHKKDHTKAVISFGFIAVFSLMILVMWLSMATLSSVNKSMSALIKDTEQKTTHAYQMRDVIRLRSSAVRSLLQIGDPVERENVFEKLIAYTDDYAESRLSLTSLGANDREKEIFHDVALVDQRIAETYDKTGTLIYNLTQDHDALASAIGEVQLQELVLLNHLNNLVQLEKVLAQESLAANQATHTKTRQLLLGIVIAAFALSLMISVHVIRQV